MLTEAVVAWYEWRQGQCDFPKGLSAPETALLDAVDRSDLTQIAKSDAEKIRKWKKRFKLMRKAARKSHRQNKKLISQSEEDRLREESYEKCEACGRWDHLDDMVRGYDEWWCSRCARAAGAAEKEAAPEVDPESMNDVEIDTVLELMRVLKAMIIELARQGWPAKGMSELVEMVKGIPDAVSPLRKEYVAPKKRAGVEKARVTLDESLGSLSAVARELAEDPRHKENAGVLKAVSAVFSYLSNGCDESWRDAWEPREGDTLWHRSTYRRGTLKKSPIGAGSEWECFWSEGSAPMREGNCWQDTAALKRDTDVELKVVSDPETLGCSEGSKDDA